MQNNNDMPGEQDHFSSHEIGSFLRFAEILERIHTRLAAEGKVRIVDGKVVFVEKDGI